MKLTSQEFIDRARLLCQTHQMQEVAKMMGTHPSVLSRFKARDWKAATYERAATRLPEDFIFWQKRETWTELVERYGCGNSTLRRWFKTIGKARRKSMKGSALRVDKKAGKRTWKLKTAKDAARIEALRKETEQRTRMELLARFDIVEDPRPLEVINHQEAMKRSSEALRDRTLWLIGKMQSGSQPQRGDDRIDTALQRMGGQFGV